MLYEVITNLIQLRYKPLVVEKVQCRILFLRLVQWVFYCKNELIDSNSKHGTNRLLHKWFYVPGL